MDLNTHSSVVGIYLVYTNPGLDICTRAEVLLCGRNDVNNLEVQSESFLSVLQPCLLFSFDYLPISLLTALQLTWKLFLWLPCMTG